MAQLLSLVIVLMSGCATIPKVEALLHTNPRYLLKPDFVGPNGPLTPRQAQQVIGRLKAQQGTPTDILQRHMVFEQAISNVPLTFGNKVTLLKNATATYPAMLSAIRSARDSINIEMYTFSNGLVGQTFADALIERQRHGVQVNLMYDALGSLGTPASFFDRLKQNGIAVVKYRPLNPFESTLPWTLSHRSHRKNLVVDGRVAFTGGINVDEVYTSGLPGIKKTKPLAYWRDTDIKIEGPAVAEFQYLFVDEWNHQKGLLLQVRDYFPKLDRQGNQIVRVIGSVPQRFSLIYVTYVSAIINSGSNVYITDAYFAPDHQMLHALEHAAGRGVDVRLLLPSIADEPLIVSAARSYYRALLEAGVKVYEWQGEMLHAKTATIDGVWSTVGSSNLDWWSIASDNEINAIILSDSFGVEMNLMFQSDLKSSKQIELDQWNHRSLHERFEETFAGMLGWLLYNL